MTTTTPTPSVAVMKLSKAGYIELCDMFRDKALTEHQDMRAKHMAPAAGRTSTNQRKNPGNEQSRYESGPGRSPSEALGRPVSRGSRRRAAQGACARARTANQARQRIQAAATERARMRDQARRTRRHGGAAA